MKNLKDNILFVHYKKEIALTELDLILDDTIFGNNPDGHDYKYIETRENGKFYWIGEGNAIEIDILIDKLNELKKDNCNFAEISIHSNHNGYYLYGLQIKSGDEKDVVIQQKKTLEEKIDKLNKSINDNEFKILNDTKKLELLNKEYLSILKKYGNEK